MKSLFSKNCGLQSEVQATKNTTISGVLSSRLLNSTMTGKSSFNSTNNKEGGKCATISKRCRTTGMLLFLSTFLLLFFISSSGILQASCPAIDPNDPCQNQWQGPFGMTIEYPYQGCFVTFEYCIRLDCTGETVISIGPTQLYGLGSSVPGSVSVLCPPNIDQNALDEAIMNSVLMLYDPPPCDDSAKVIEYGRPACATLFYPTEIICVFQSDAGYSLHFNYKSVSCAQVAYCWSFLYYCWQPIPYYPFMRLLIERETGSTPVNCPPNVHFMDLDGFFFSNKFRDYIFDYHGLTYRDIRDSINAGSTFLWDQYMAYIEDEIEDNFQFFIMNNLGLSPCMPTDIDKLRDELLEFLRNLSQDGFIGCNPNPDCE